LSPVKLVEGSPLTVDDFRKSGGDAAGGDERRREPRIACDKEVAIRTCRTSDERGFRPARLIDCSVHGLGLSTDEPMDAGEQFLVRFQLDRMMLAVYTVRYCRRLSGRHVVGAALCGFIGGADDPDAVEIMAALTAAGEGAGGQ